MAHPYKSQADSSNKSKRGNMGKEGNLVIPVMKAVGENKRGGIHGSSASMQHKDQSAAPGMKRGGHVGKHRHSKPKTKIVIAAPAGDVGNPPSPDPALAAAGAASSPAPAPMPPSGAPPMAKRGGRMTAGADSGVGRLQKAKSAGMKPIKG